MTKTLKLMFLSLTMAAAGSVLAATPPYAASPALPQVHKLHETYYVQPHNTFDRAGSLIDWLNAGFRTVELDIIDRGNWEFEPDGPYVSHDSSPANQNCSGNPDRLGHCLRDLTDWLQQNPGSGPLLVFIDMKASWDPLNAWHADEVGFLDDKVRSIVGDALYTSDDLYQYATGSQYAPGLLPFRHAVSQAGWPTLSAIGDKLVVFYTGGKIGLVNQTQAAGIEYIMGQPGRRLPYGFFCPDVESSPNQIVPGGTLDGVSNATSQLFVCSNLKSRDHYQITANTSEQHNQIIHLWGDHVYGNGSYTYNYLAVAHGISVVGRDSNETQTWGNSLPLVGVRRSLPGYFELRPTHVSNKCIDVKNSGSGNATQIQLWDCNGSAAQQFVYSAEGQLRPKHYNPSCVDIKGGKAGGNKQVHLWDCDGGESEKWAIDNSGRFHNRHSGEAYCLDVESGATGNGSKMVTNTCSSANSQKFMLVPALDWMQSSF